MKQTFLDLRDIIGTIFVRWGISMVGDEDLKVNLFLGYHSALKSSLEQEIKNNTSKDVN